MAAAPSQPTVFEPSDAQYGIFYWIHLNGKALDNCNTVQNIVKSCSRIHHTAQRVDDPTGLKVGVGFGKKFLKQITEILKRKKELQGLRDNFLLLAERVKYQDWKIGKKIVLPSKGGDIFVHAKGNNVGTLYEFQHVFYNTLPHKSVDPEKTSITRGFTFQHHRDISGYMDGIANPATTEERRNWAVLSNTGGSFVITQKWAHRMDTVKVERPDDAIVDQQNQWIGRKRENGRLLEDIQPRAHVNLMRKVQEGEGSAQIVRQSLPYTEENGHSGLFFLAYANNTDVFERMLAEMTNGEGDMLFGLSANTSGTYWYFLGMTELENLYKNI